MTDSDDIQQLLKNGWEIAGYASNMLAMGAVSHHVLLRQGANLTSVTILVNSGKEVGRTTTVLSPAPSAPAKKGFFG